MIRRLARPTAATALAVVLVANSVVGWSGTPVQGDTPGSEVLDRQPLSTNLYLPAVKVQTPTDFAPSPAAPLGQAIRDVVLQDGWLYAAMGSHVVSFREIDGALEPVDVSEALTGIVYDLDAADGVVYAAHMAMSSRSLPAEPGGLTVLASESGALRVLSRLVLDEANGYGSVVVTGDTVAAMRCKSEQSGIVCDSIEAIDVREVTRPRLLGTVGSPHDTDFLPGLAELSGNRVTDGAVVVEVGVEGPPVAVEWLEWPVGKPVAGDDMLVTFDEWGEVHLFRTGGGDIAEVDMISVYLLGLQHGVTAAALAPGGVMLSGPAEDLDRAGRSGRQWVWVPIDADGFGTPVHGTSDWIDGALTYSDGVVWHGMSSGLLPGNGPQPFMPSLGYEPAVDGRAPDGHVVGRWTGWNWATYDVAVSGNVAYALADAGGTWYPDETTDLLVYDISEPRLPTLIGSLRDVCPDMRWNGTAPLEMCSVVSVGSGRVLVSSAQGASVVSAADPAYPLIVTSGPSLGVHLEAVPEGVLALRHGMPSSLDAQLVLYDTTGSWPVERWSSAVGPAGNVAVDSSSGRTLVAVASGDPGPVEVRAGWIGASHPPSFTDMEDDGDGLVWSTRSLLVVNGSIILAYGHGESERSGVSMTAPLAEQGATSEHEPSLRSYRLSEAGVELEWSVRFLAGDSGWPKTTTALVGRQILVGHYHSLESFTLGAGSAPTGLGFVPYSWAVLTGDHLQDEDDYPRLIPVGPRHVYVTGHAAGQVMEIANR